MGAQGRGSPGICAWLKTERPSPGHTALAALWEPGGVWRNRLEGAAGRGWGGGGEGEGEGMTKEAKCQQREKKSGGDSRGQAWEAPGEGTDEVS